MSNDPYRQRGGAPDQRGRAPARWQVTRLTPEEWGHVAVSLPGWQWMPGMLGSSGKRITVVHYGGDGWSIEIGGIWGDPDDETIDPDDPATAGCLLALLGEYAWMVSLAPDRSGKWYVTTAFEREYAGSYTQHDTLGRACIAAAVALGRWPA